MGYDESSNPRQLLLYRGIGSAHHSRRQGGQGFSPAQSCEGRLPIQYTNIPWNNKPYYYCGVTCSLLIDLLPIASLGWGRNH